MSVNYQNLLRTAEELQSEQIQVETQQQLDKIDKAKWIQSFETQQLITSLRQSFEECLDNLLMNDFETETWIRAQISKLRVIKTIINNIIN